MTPTIDPTTRLEECREQAFQAARFGAYMNERLLEGGPLAATRALVEMQLDTAAAVLDAVRGDRDGLDVVGELGSRTRAGLRYDLLVQTLGRQLFGSARLPGEELLGEDAHYRLVYIPAKAGVEPQAPLFHVGGVLPYGDRVFRLLPESCFYERFTERGMPVYALELKGDSTAIDYSGLTLEKVIDAIAHFSGLAFDHAKGQKMVLEGYCALASQTLAYALARPLEANARFRVVATFVGPVDGTRCKSLAEIMRLMPEEVLATSYRSAELTGGYIGGDNLRTTQDVALAAFFGKTPLGRFAAGWKKPEYAAVDGIESLTPEMRRDLAGTYWTSPENCRRWPVPLDLSKFSSSLFTRGVGIDGGFAGTYQGRPLHLADGLKGTRLQFVGFYGGKDPLVPEVTAEPMKQILGNRYTHVVHPNVGHVAYLFSPKAWDAANPKGFKPNPVDALLDAYGKASAKKSTAA